MTFDEWLKKIQDEMPEVLAHLVRAAVAFQAMQAKAANLPPAEANGPDTFEVGKSWALTTKPLSTTELDAVYNQYATGLVKEKALNYVKGFIAGLTIAGGA